MRNFIQINDDKLSLLVDTTGGIIIAKEGGYGRFPRRNPPVRPTSWSAAPTIVPDTKVNVCIVR